MKKIISLIGLLATLICIACAATNSTEYGKSTDKVAYKTATSINVVDVNTVDPSAPDKNERGFFDIVLDIVLDSVFSNDRGILGVAFIPGGGM